MGTMRRSRKQCRMFWDWFDKNQKRRSTATRMRRTRRRARPRTVRRTTVSQRKKTHTEEKLKNKFARRQGRDAGHHEQVQGGEVRGQGNLEWNTDLVEAAQDLDDGETRHESRDAQAREYEEVQWTKHASRSDSQAQQHDLTSRGGVLEERVYARCPQHMSNTTNTAQPQGLALCFRCHPAWASEGTPGGSRQGHRRYTGAR